MNFFDYWVAKPSDELQSAWDRVPHTEYAQIGSLKGRAVCVLKIISHTASVVIKPIVYIATGITLIAMHSLVFIVTILTNPKEKVRMSFLHPGANLILTGCVSPIGQVFQVFKAIIGILHPACYFKEDELHKYFVQLAHIAEEMDCDDEFVKIIKDGAQSVNKNLHFTSSRSYYYALYKRDLSIICNKLNDSNLSDDQKIATLDMLAPLPDHPDITGINACCPGLGRILEHMRSYLDVPHDPEQIIPWLEGLYKIDILNLMTMQSDLMIKYWSSVFTINETEEVEEDRELALAANHFANFLIVTLGPQIGLSDDMIEIASQDLYTSIPCFVENEEEELLAIYNGLYSEDDFIAYLSNRINSQPDGEIGLKKFRDHITQLLCNSISEEEINSSLEEVQKQFNLSDILADDPIYYVKFHYYLYPDAHPSDECSTDLNEEGIKAFLAIVRHKHKHKE